MQDIAIIHRRAKEKSLQQTFPEAPIWSTCLRELAFLNQEEVKNYLSQIETNKPETDEVYTGEEAYQFLLEILCGLHSEVFAETEVFGQFKIFIQKQVSEENAFMISRGTLFQQLMTDVKSLRAEFLTHIGSQSYGSILRKMIHKESQVAILGSGHLVGEVLPWLCQSNVHVFARNLAKALELQKDHRHIEVQGLGRIQGFDYVLVCAPMDNSSLYELIDVKQNIVDLRGEAELSLEKTHYTSFKDLMVLAQQEQKSLLAIKEKVVGKISELTENFKTKSWIRPFGWDDLCA